MQTIICALHIYYILISIYGKTLLISPPALALVDVLLLMHNFLFLHIFVFLKVKFSIIDKLKVKQQQQLCDHESSSYS
jgi:hypothetical protein